MIRLRRPATLLLSPTPFVPDGADLDDIDERWDRLCASNPSCFDGRLLHVHAAQRNGCGGAAVHVSKCPYRFFAVQDDEFDLGVRPLGAKGMTWRDGNVLLGLRGEVVRHHAGDWEFAPAGCVEPGKDPAEVITRELHEETGLLADRPPAAIAIFFDATARTWELVFEIYASTGAATADGREYTELYWADPADAAGMQLSPAAAAMVPLLRTPMSR